MSKLDGQGAAWVSIILAIGFSIGFIVFCGAVIWDAVVSNNPGLSENATQVLTGWGGGVTGILGAYVGYRAASKPPSPTDDTTTAPADPTAPRH